MKMRTISKKLLAILLSVAMCASIGIVTIVAATSSPLVQFTAGEVSGEAGQEVTVPVDFSAVSGTTVGAIRLDINYDKDKLELAKRENGKSKLVFGRSFGIPVYNDLVPGELIFAPVNIEGFDNETMVEITFKIKEGAKGVVPIQCTAVTVTTLSDVNITSSSTVKNGSVTVIQPEVPLQSIAIDPSSLTMTKGDTQKLSVVCTPTNTTDDTTATWTSKDPSIASVDQDGNVTAMGKGQTTITAQVGDKTATCAVDVNKVPVESITLDQTKVSLNKGATQTVAAQFNPSDATNTSELKWSSNKESVATVNNGVITAVGTGTATITAWIGDVKATCEVTVTTPLESITLNKSTASILKGQTEKLSVSYNPIDSDTKPVATWKSSDEAVASVDQNGTVTAIAKGTATITATAGGFSDTCVVTVEEHELNSISFDKANMELNKGKTDTLTIIYTPENTTDDKDAVWTTSNSKVATVVDGVVTAVDAGTAIIKASVNGKEATCEVTVKSPLVSIALDQTSASLNKGEHTTLSVTYNPTNTTDAKTVKWTTSDPTIATVDATGKITAVRAGQATITAQSDVAGVQPVSCVITVNAPLTAISIDATAQLNKGATKTLAVTYDPADTTDNKAITWSSSNKNIVTVDENGTITAVGAGQATVTAQSAVTGVQSVACVVTVKAPLTGISLDANAQINVGDTKTLSVTYNPADTTDSKDVTWSSSNTDVATVNAQTGVITAVAVGTTTITATSTIAGVKPATTELTVKLPLISIALDKTTTSIRKGKTDTLTVSYNPTETTDDKTVVWTSSNPDVAVVQNGVVTAKAAGTTTITATSNVDGVNPVTCEVTVTEIKIESITLNKTNETLNKGDQLSLIATVNPENTTDDTTVAWTSSNPNSATVDANGVVTAVGAGEATITATAGNKSAECKITVLVPLGSIALSKTETTVFVNKTTSLEVLFNPTDTTDDKTTTWTSSDTKVATVDAMGKVTGVAAGTAMITATVGTKTATCTVNVMQVEDKIPTQIIIDQIKDPTITKIQVNLTTADTVSQDIFAAAKGVDKEIVFNIVDENGKTLYAWSFNGKDVTDATKDVDLSIKLNAKNDGISSLITDNNSMVLSFAFDGKLPATASVKVFVGDKYTDGQELWLYHFNEQTKELEFSASKLVVKDGYVVLSISECSDYVLTAKEYVKSEPVPPTSSVDSSNNSGTGTGTSSSSKTPTTGDTKNLAIYVVALITAMGAGVVLLMRRKHN